MNVYLQCRTAKLYNTVVLLVISYEISIFHFFSKHKAHKSVTFSTSYAPENNYRYLKKKLLPISHNYSYTKSIQLNTEN